MTQYIYLYNWKWSEENMDRDVDKMHIAYVYTINLKVS